MNNKAYAFTLISTMGTICMLMDEPLTHPATAAEAMMQHLVHNAEEYGNLWDTLDSRFVHVRDIPQDNGGIGMVSLTFEHTENEDDLWTFHVTQEHTGGHTTIDLIQDGVIQ